MLKLIEFRTRHEGEILSEAFITFGKHAGVETRSGRYFDGYYISACIPAIKMTRGDLYGDCRITGWYGYRVQVGYWLLPNNYNSFRCHAWWELLKEISHITGEQLMEKQNNQTRSHNNR